MSRTTLTRRLAQVGTRVPLGCSACRTQPQIVILHDDDPEPPMACPACGRAYPSIRVIRLVRDDRGAQ